MIPSVFKWWYDHPYIPVSLLALGIVLCHMSGNSNFAHSHTLTFDDEVKTEYTPNLKLLYSGWLIVGFSLTHLYFSSIINFIRQIHFNKQS